MRLIFAAIAASLIAFPGWAQEEQGFFGRLFGTDTAATDQEQGGLLESFIEDNLSGEGRQVSITGFAGALSGRATLETLTIADAGGAWLTLRDVVLDWDRAALFRGRLSVSELSAAEIEFPRRPIAAESSETPTPEASGFQLPELPVAVAIDQISASRVFIGQPVFGTEANLSVNGGLQLADGQGSAELALEKLDAVGAITLAASFDNTSNVLAIDLNVSEGEDGIVAGLLDMPGRPSVDFTVAGEAPIRAFTADIRLATDGAERLTGQITTGKPEDESDVSLRTEIDVAGDISPIFAPEYQPFFGSNVALSAAITSFLDGAVAVEDIQIASEALDLTGNIEIGSDGLPAKIAVEGAIASGNGPVLLPLSGDETRVDRVDLDISFDADNNDLWVGRFALAGLDRSGFSAESIALNGSGLIVSGTPQAVSASFEFAAEALDLGNPDAEAALGETVTGSVDLSWLSGDPLRLTDLVINGESYGLSGDAVIALEEEGPDISGQITARASDLGVFSGLAGRNLGGRLDLATNIAVQPLAGTFNITARGSSTDLIVDQEQADKILAGEAELDATASRDANGIAFELRTLNTPNAELTGQAQLRSGGSFATVSGRIDQASILLPGVVGPVSLNANATEDDNRVWSWQIESGLDGAFLAASGTATDVFDTPIIATNGRVAVDDLSNFAELVGRPLRGAIESDFAGEVVADLSRLSGNLNGTATDLVTGLAEADRLLDGTVRFTVDAARAGNVTTVRNSNISGDYIEATVNGVLVPEAGRFDVKGRLADASRVLDGAPAEAFDFAARGTQDGKDWRFETRASGAGLNVIAEGDALDPTGPAAEVDGRVQASADDLSILAGIIGQPLAGRIALDIEGRVNSDLTRFALSGGVNGTGLRVGQEQADALLRGDVTATLDASREGETIDLTRFDLSSDLLRLSAAGAVSSDGGSIDLEAGISDVAAFAPEFSGPATITGTLSQGGEAGYDLNLSATGPGGTRLTTQGRVATDFQTVDLNVAGQAPLNAANSYISPRALTGTANFQLAINGPPGLGAVSGQITSREARFIDSTLGVILNQLSLDAAINGGRATLDLSASVENGGRISVNGPIGLTAPFTSDLVAALDRVVLRDARLFETSVTGDVAIVGPLAGGARISGDLSLGETNIRIPSTGIGGSGEIPEIVHLNEPPPVRGTRRRAGLLASATQSANGSGPSYPLNVTISAPNQIFIRGRGLDSELGGDLRISGTTKNVIPIGAFNLVRGRLDILGRRMTLEEATATIQGSFLPSVRIIAVTQVDEYTILVTVSGPVDDPEITFSSDPDLPQEEVLARLIFGRGLETLSPVQAARLALAVRTLAGRGGEGVVGNIRQGAGLADLDVTTDENGNAAVRAGAYLGENIYTDVTVGASGDTEVNINLDVSPSVTIKGTVGNTGETSVGVFFERDY